ncbi:MAG: fructosamine kinase family protein [Micrococcales bacterium]|nr:fructosamine kinase family protein [Micrococcales bacterium]
MTAVYRKGSVSAPAGYFRWEAAGLRWLAAAEGARTVSVVGAADDHLDLERLAPATPTASAAEAFGRGLARTHLAGATAFGAPPDGWTGDGFLGPLSEPLPLRLVPCETWGELYGMHRVLSTARQAMARGVLCSGDLAVVERVVTRLRDGEFDDGRPPARIHGDLWSGNLMWLESEAVLIDPAAHGGHAETDLAMLDLFGAPHLERILAAYQAVSPLADGWQGRVALHQLHPVLLHAVLFGGGYAAQAMRIARAYA